jgi:hypothetical protein
MARGSWFVRAVSSTPAGAACPVPVNGETAVMSALAAFGPSPVLCDGMSTGRNVPLGTNGGMEMKKLALGIACIASLLIPLAIVQSASAATTTSIPGCPRTITNTDNAATITLARGSCATLQLDKSLDWSVPQSSSSAVGVFDTESFAPDQQWGLSARHSGRATITSLGRPHCDPGQICPLFVVQFSVNIDVVGPYGT